MEEMGNTIKVTQGTRFTVVEMVMVIMGMVDMGLQEGMALADLGEMEMIQEKVHLHLQKARSCNLHVTFVADVNSSKSSSLRVEVKLIAGAMVFVLNVQTATSEARIVSLTRVSVGVVPENERKTFVDDPDTIYKGTTKAISRHMCSTIPPISL
jgi:hypothetical protein